MRGKIIKGIAGFYYVDIVGSGIYQCRARGLFRKEGTKPLVGDDVEVELLHTEDVEGNVLSIYPRKNELIRPAAANVDQALLVFAKKDPAPNFRLLDRFLLSMQLQQVPAALCLNKMDLPGEDQLQEEVAAAYGKLDLPLFFISVRTGAGMDALWAFLKDKTTLLAGPSGVGKSSLTNALQSEVRMEVGEISKKLKRGKNTTRHAELIALQDGGYLCDTPGFTSFAAAAIKKEELKDYYPEFHPYLNQCHFDSCVHIDEPKCAVKTAVAKGAISRLRYENYRAIYEKLYEEEKKRGY